MKSGSKQSESPQSESEAMSADELRRHRESLDMSQAALARYLQISLSSVRRYERGNDIPASVARVVRSIARRGLPEGWSITTVGGEEYVRRPDGEMVSIDAAIKTPGGLTLSMLIDDLGVEWMKGIQV